VVPSWTIKFDFALSKNFILQDLRLSQRFCWDSGLLAHDTMSFGWCPMFWICISSKCYKQVFHLNPHAYHILRGKCLCGEYQNYSGNRTCYVVDLAMLFFWRQKQHFFYVLLTVHLSITLANDQLDAQIFNTFIMILYMYMFQAISFSSSGGQIVLTHHLVSSLSVSDCLVHCTVTYWDWQYQMLY
jgi:hypothetical protein